MSRQVVWETVRWGTDDDRREAVTSVTGDRLLEQAPAVRREPGRRTAGRLTGGLMAPGQTGTRR